MNKQQPQWISWKSHQIECPKIVDFVSSQLSENSKTTGNNKRTIVMKRKSYSALTRCRNDIVQNKSKYLEIGTCNMINVIDKIENNYDAISKTGDENNKISTVWVQAGVSMKVLVDTLLSIGYLPCVIPEFKQITCGGACSGFGIESSSFKFGLFHEIVIEYQCLSISAQGTRHAQSI